MRMTAEKLKILAVFAVVGLLVLAVPLLRLAGGDDDGGTVTPREDFVPLSSQLRGLWLQVHTNSPDCPFEDYIQEIAATGANTVGLSISAVQQNASSASVYVDRQRTPSDERLVGMLEVADELKLRTVLMPIVLLTHPRGSEWRGQIDPPDWSAWWASYSEYILHYAALAQEHGVDVFIVGSELIQTERQEDRWRGLIAAIRRQSREILDRQFREQLKARHPDWTADQWREAYGIASIDALAPSTAEALPAELRSEYEAFVEQRRMLLSYSANWDHYTVPKFWDALDAVGMTSYYNLNPRGVENPTVESLSEAWAPIRNEIAAWQRKVNKPILFMEVGWPSQDGCSIEPWNYVRSQTMALVEQQRCMQSFLQTFAKEPWVGGVLVWKWRDHPGMTGTLDADDAARLNYPPIGKPVMDDLRAFFTSPNGLAEQPDTTD